MELDQNVEYLGPEPVLIREAGIADSGLSCAITLVLREIFLRRFCMGAYKHIHRQFPGVVSTNTFTT